MRLTAAILSALLVAPVAAADPVVVELYTSQGCSSCPPADALMEELAARDGVIALAFHVDYWDWIGWEDTFGQAAFTARQRSYAGGEGSSMVFTPQFVVGGVDSVAGADGMDLAETVRAHEEATPDLLRVMSGPEGAKLHVGAGEGGRLTLLHVLPRAEVDILSGENAGRRATYHRVVRDMEDLGPWDGAEAAMPLAPAPEGLERVVLAQAVGPDGRLGRILGAVAAD